MAPKTKSKTPASTASAAPASTASAAPASTASAAPAAPVATAAVVAPPAPPTSVAAPTISTENVVLTDASDVSSDFSALVSDFMTKLSQSSALFTTLKSEFRTLQKKYEREIKLAQKSSAKRKRKTGNRAPSGFVKPTKISDELATFLDKPIGSEMARTDVTREINKYIVAHNLKNKENGRRIDADGKLTTLLKLDKTDVLTYFNLQRFMSPHFAKSSKVLTPAPTTA